MSVESFMIEDITILSPANTTNRYNDVIADWSNPIEINTKAWIIQQNSNEPGQGTRPNQVISDWIMAIRGTVPITSRDRVRYGSLTFEVIGDPRIAKTMIDTSHHKEITLRLVKG